MKQESSLSSWDSPRSAAKFIVGLFLFVGLFSFVRFGVNQLLFLKNFDSPTSVTKINLLENPNANFSKGYYEVTGFIGAPLEYVYYGGDTGATTFYYYPLFSDVDRTNIRLLIQDTRTPIFREIDPTVMTITGIIGIESTPSEIQKKLNAHPALLVFDTTPPQFFKVLLWFTPTVVGFFIGIYLILQWLLKLKRQVL